MSTFILIHGAMMGGWCWYKVVPLLEQQGHTVIAPDLPSHGRDKTPLAAVSLQAYVDSVGKLLDGQRESVILGGHSMGGAVITQVAEERPEKIKVLVYVAAPLLHDGEAIFQLLQQDTESLAAVSMTFAPDQSYVTMREEAIKDAACGDCSEEDIALVKALQVPQAVAPLSTPVHTSAANFGRLRRVYIECLRDRAATPAFQKKLYTALPCEKVLSLNTSHSPLFSAPRELAAHLMAL
jgi:pimeloyl-ACP methyl ester carboxylesterase